MQDTLGQDFIIIVGAEGQIAKPDSSRGALQLQASIDKYGPPAEFNLTDGLLRSDNWVLGRLAFDGPSGPVSWFDTQHPDYNADNIQKTTVQNAVEPKIGGA